MFQNKQNIPFHSRNFLKRKAIKLRRSGLSYNEINQKINVPKTTLSDWLHSIKLTEKQTLRLKSFSAPGRIKASQAHTTIRVNRTQQIFRDSKQDITEVSKKDLWYMGIMLYWAEGSKQKEHNVSTRVCFTNSDPSMIKLYLKWLKECLNIEGDNISFEIYIHKSYKKTRKELIDYWSEVTGFLLYEPIKIYFKQNKIHSFRKNRGEKYFGVLRITVLKSTDLNRKISGWVKAICERTDCLPLFSH